MNGVLGMAVLLSETGLDATQREMLDTITYSGRGLLTIINDDLDFPKIEAGHIDIEKTPVDMRQMLGNLRRLLSAEAGRKGIGFAVKIPDDLTLRHLGDPIRIKRILTNVAGNAIKFTDGGKVLVYVLVEETGGEGQHLRFDVCDTGIGMSPAQLQRVFGKFEEAESTSTRRFGGTGLGLSIARSLAEAMGGTLAATSAEGRGNTFTFAVVLPVAFAVANANGESAAAAKEAPPPPGIEVLVADDDAVNRRFAETMLARLGCVVTLVEDGARAVEQFRAGHPRHRPYGRLDARAERSRGHSCHS